MNWIIKAFILDNGISKKGLEEENKCFFFFNNLFFLVDRMDQYMRDIENLIWLMDMED